MSISSVFIAGNNSKKLEELRVTEDILLGYDYSVVKQRSMNKEDNPMSMRSF